jgi:hypothetical protein
MITPNLLAGEDRGLLINWVTCSVYSVACMVVALRYVQQAAVGECTTDVLTAVRYYTRGWICGKFGGDDLFIGLAVVGKAINW